MKRPSCVPSLTFFPASRMAAYAAEASPEDEKGDRCAPSPYSAVREQAEIPDKTKIPCEVVPGVSEASPASFKKGVAGIDRHAVIIAGDAVGDGAPWAERSKLYDGRFSHGFRKG